MPSLNEDSPHDQQTAPSTKQKEQVLQTEKDESLDVVLSPEEVRQKKLKRKVITFTVLLLLVVGSVFWYLRSQTFEDTDDAQVDGHIAPISARIPGTVTAVYVQDNQFVQAGAPLIDLDTRTQVVSVDQNRAQLLQAQAQLEAQQPNVSITRTNSRADVSSDDAQLAQAVAGVAVAESDYQQSSAKLADAQAQAARDQAQLQRYKTLFEKKEASREEYERYAATSTSANANVSAAQAAIVSSSRIVDQRKAQVAAQRTKREQDTENAPRQLAIRTADIETQRANAQSAKAALEKATLDLSFTKVVAPVSGIVTQRSAEIGTHVAEGSQLMMLVQTDDLWVTANFKETQLRRMQPQQRVTIHVDALDRDFDGYVDSLPAITGSRSSVLPPENATGNYVKVVQRMSVRVRFKPNQAGLDLLRPGMSVESHVYLK